MSTQWTEGNRLPFCAVCCEYVVESTTRYTCAVCDDGAYEGKHDVPLPTPRTPGWPRARVGGAA